MKLLNLKLVKTLANSPNLLLFQHTACGKENDKDDEIDRQYYIQCMLPIFASAEVFDFDADSIGKELLLHAAA